MINTEIIIPNYYLEFTEVSAMVPPPGDRGVRNGISLEMPERAKFF